MRKTGRDRAGRQARRRPNPRQREPLVEKPRKVARRNWTLMSDDEVIEYAKNQAAKKGIGSRSELGKTDSSLYAILLERKLIDRIGFKADERAWSRYANAELLELARRIIDDNGITSRSELSKHDRPFYCALVKRKLIGEVGLEIQRPWSEFSDDELVEYIRRFVGSNDIESRVGLKRARKGLYLAVTARGLIGRVRFKADERAWRRYSDDELVAYARRFVGENGIGKRSGLWRTDRGLYAVLQSRDLMCRVLPMNENDNTAQGMKEIVDGLAEFGGKS